MNPALGDRLTPRKDEAFLSDNMYGTMYGMKRTTIYLPEGLKAALERRAAAESRTEADVIREALAEKLAAGPAPAPRIPLTGTGLGDPTLAERVDELIEGFGQR